jgi:hypothetical protein
MDTLFDRADGDVDTIDALLFIRRELLAGRPLWIFTGDSTAQSLVAFIQGYCASLSYNRRPDDRYRGFVAWLRDTMGEFPAAGWHTKYLAEADGDHGVAVIRFLDRCANYVAMARVP